MKHTIIVKAFGNTVTVGHTSSQMNVYDKRAKQTKTSYSVVDVKFSDWFMATTS